MKSWALRYVIGYVTNHRYVIDKTCASRRLLLSLTNDTGAPLSISNIFF